MREFAFTNFVLDKWIMKKTMEPIICIGFYLVIQRKKSNLTEIPQSDVIIESASSAYMVASSDSCLVL